MKVSFKKTKTLESDFLAIDKLEQSVEYDQVRNQVSFQLDQANIDMHLVGTWGVEVTDAQLFQGVLFSIQMVIVAGCQK